MTTPKVRFTEFEARCKRCRFFVREASHHTGVPMYDCAIALTERSVRPTLWDVWQHYKRDWCPKFDEVPPESPTLLRRLGKGLGLC